MCALLEVNHEPSIQRIHSLEILEQLQPEWSDLWKRCPQATPFQSPDWLIPFWRHVGEGELAVVSLRKNGRLVALAPLIIYSRLHPACREVALLGTGVSDYLDVLVAPGFEKETVERLAAWLLDHHFNWELLDFQQLCADSPLLNREAFSGTFNRIEVQEVCPVLNLPSNPEDLGRNVPAHMLQKLKYYRRRIARLGDVRIELAVEETFGELFDRFLSLHRARWQTRGLEGVLADSCLKEFHREAAQNLLASGILRLYGLRLNGQIIAALYSFSHGVRSFFYLSGFDPEFSMLSPGTLLIGHAIDQAILEGCVEFDFLRGREAYKYMWGAKGRLSYRRQIFAAQNRAEAA